MIFTFLKISDNRYIFKTIFIYFWERWSMSGGRAEREGDTESETGFRLWAVSTEPGAGLQPTNHEIMTWAEVGRSTDWATQASHWFKILCKKCTPLMPKPGANCSHVSTHGRYATNGYLIDHRVSLVATGIFWTWASKSNNHHHLVHKGTIIAKTLP